MADDINTQMVNTRRQQSISRASDSRRPQFTSRNVRFDSMQKSLYDSQVAEQQAYINSPEYQDYVKQQAEIDSSINEVTTHINDLQIGIDNLYASYKDKWAVGQALGKLDKAKLWEAEANSLKGTLAKLQDGYNISADQANRIAAAARDARLAKINANRIPIAKQQAGKPIYSVVDPRTGKTFESSNYNFIEGKVKEFNRNQDIYNSTASEKALSQSLQEDFRGLSLNQIRSKAIVDKLIKASPNIQTKSKTAVPSSRQDRANYFLKKAGYDPNRKGQPLFNLVPRIEKDIKESQTAKKILSFVKGAYYGKNVKAKIETDPNGNRVLVLSGNRSKIESGLQKFKDQYNAKWGVYLQNVPGFRKSTGVTEENKRGENAVITLALLTTGAEAALSAPTLTSNLIKYGTAIIKPEVLTEPADFLYSKIPGQSNPSKFSKGYAFGYTTTKRLPVLGLAYGSQIVRSLIRDPVGTASGFYEGFKSNPAENVGLILGGSERFTNLAEANIRKALGQSEFKFEIVDIPGYGKVKVLNTEKYGKIVYVEGKYAQSEKLPYAEQIKLSLRPQRIIFTQGSPSAIPLSKLGKGSGYEVISTKPMRGLYESPSMKFLVEAKKIIDTESGVLTHYLEAGGRSRFIRPGDIKKLITGEAKTGGRPSIQLRRGSYPKTQQWLIDTANSLDRNGRIPPQHLTKINALFERFLEEPIVNQGETFVGKEKLNLVNNINLKGLGKGDKLKVYAALLQFSKESKTPLIAGPEIISRIIPYGSENQVLSDIGRKFYRRSFNDLRKAKGVSKLDKVVELVTGVKRGQAFARIGGDLVEFDFVRTYLGKGKKIKNVISEVRESKTPLKLFEEDLVKEVSRDEPLQRVRTPSGRIPSSRRAINRVNDILLGRDRSDRTNRNRGSLSRISSRVRQVSRNIERSRARADRTVTRFDLVRRSERARERPSEVRGRIRPSRARSRPNITRTLTPAFRMPSRPKGERQLRRRILRKEKRRGRGYVLTPTIGQQVFSFKRLTPIRLSKVTGFEVSRT